MKDILIQALAPVAATVISTLASLALFEFKKFITTRTKNENVNAAMTRITETVQTTVDNLTQTVAISLKEKSETGKLTRNQGNVLKQDAVKAVLKQLPEDTVKAAGQAVNSVQGLIGAKVEQAVLKQKAVLPTPVKSDYLKIRALESMGAYDQIRNNLKNTFTKINLTPLNSSSLAEAMSPTTKNTEGA